MWGVAITTLIVGSRRRHSQIARSTRLRSRSNFARPAVSKQPRARSNRRAPAAECSTAVAASTAAEVTAAAPVAEVARSCRIIDQIQSQGHRAYDRHGGAAAAVTSLAFDAADHQALDDQALRQRVHDYRRDGSDECAGHHLAPVENVLAQHLRQADCQRPTRQ